MCFPKRLCRPERVCTEVQGKLFTLAREFLPYLEAERGCSRLTVSSYASDLRLFLAHLQGSGQPGEPTCLTLPNARSWIVQMHRAGLSPTTVARRISALKSFARYLEEQGHTDRNEIARLQSPARQQTLPTYLGQEELLRIRDAALRQRTAYAAFRDYAMLSVLIFTGLRRGELLNLRLGDVDFTEKTLRVTKGKGNKTRIVPLVQEAIEAIQDWLVFRRTKGHAYLFTTIRGNRIYPSRLQATWKKVLARSGVTRPGVTLHTLRHSLATLLLQSGQADLVSIQHILGHSRLDTTGIYLHVVPSQLRQAVEAHPLVVSHSRDDYGARR